MSWLLAKSASGPLFRNGQIGQWLSVGRPNSQAALWVSGQPIASACLSGTTKGQKLSTCGWLPTHSHSFFGLGWMCLCNHRSALLFLRSLSPHSPIMCQREFEVKKAFGKRQSSCGDNSLIFIHPKHTHTRCIWDPLCEYMCFPCSYSHGREGMHQRKKSTAEHRKKSRLVEKGTIVPTNPESRERRCDY